ncbi:MAG: L,D-transpeptidase [Bacteroidetes bacterium]|nr:L,D-transpeptidase [Bacteroidota bacterium]
MTTRRSTTPDAVAFRAASALLLFVLLALGAASCNNGRPEPGREETAGVPHQASDSARHADSAAKVSEHKLSVAEAKFPEIKYTRLALSSRTLLDSVRRRFGKTKDGIQAFRAITTLNRKEFGFIRLGDTVVVPDTVIGDMRAYSVFPEHYPAADTLPKLILISNKYQCYACYEYGHLVRFAACNTGTERKATFPGRYALNWKERLRTSSLNENWKLPFTFNFHLYAGNAFHQFVMPGRPVSHSCVRQFMPDAEWLFSWGEGAKRDGNGRMIPLTGTPVIIIDVFDFNRPRGGPWLELASNRENVLKLPEHPMGVEEAWIPLSQVPADARGGIPNRQRYLVAEDTLRARGQIRPNVHLSASIDYNKLHKAKEAAKARAAAARAKAQGGTEQHVVVPVEKSGNN